LEGKGSSISHQRFPLKIKSQKIRGQGRENRKSGQKINSKGGIKEGLRDPRAKSITDLQNRRARESKGLD